MGLAWIESLDAAGNLFFMEMQGRADGADSVTPPIERGERRLQLAPPVPAGAGDGGGGSGLTTRLRQPCGLGGAWLRRDPEDL